MKDKRTVLEEVGQLRLRLGWSWQQLAAHAGVDRTTLFRACARLTGHDTLVFKLREALPALRKLATVADRERRSA